MTRTAVVTGASTGIGEATVRMLTANGWRVFGSMRKAGPHDFGPSFHPLRFDVTDGPAILAAAAEVRQALAGETLGALVNNAGIAVAGPVLHLSVEQFRHQQEVNLVGAFAVTKAFLPQLGADRTLRGAPGRIVNISSMAGKIGWPMLGAYSASKHGLEGLSESMRRELMLFGIEVSIVGPGAVKTPIWAKSGDLTPFLGTEYEGPLKRLQTGMADLEARGLEADDVARVIVEALTVTRPKPRYKVVRSAIENYWLPVYMPKRWFDRLMAKRLGLLKK